MFQIWSVMRKCTVVAKKELFYAWPFGLAAWLCGLIFIDRLNSGKSRDAINKAAEDIKKDQVFLSSHLISLFSFRIISNMTVLCAGEVVDFPRRNS